ncbi:phosphopantothenoylcysteine decarboxylase [candidate division WOR-1 bacterium RIFCSPHIGHO2_01_FULL_53_15]|uniref:Coenzyme A biosynthesis bifunctional protein CoaBC n=1 Tax=candidate division WOR-1 bacterium RIFCSPHIGHO2_01_FULL_53_15 TaxID=1802564 RepID=A0A1F4Q0Q3_UNCSA|nr:MAG: phosphopantothenoylcysteine decarboxylase [candidate division WOR-1 bacterium RIFCSPHIGHO2_01_FULL_53_15]OGC10755.1 MAG: phosphopantothenoylcysteine decarboxylase [candidate division WOR-1 bacterium RIFCSPHIGHO2_02_FULL_53_26]
MLNGKTIILGVTGGIAAYKACELVSRLKKLNADVRVVMTKEATKLIGPITLRTLSGNPVVTDLFTDEPADLPVPHIALAQKADLIIIAPCTANIIGKLAGGIADDALTTIVMASPAKKLIAPAMNCEMWRNPVVQDNIAKLGVRSFEFVGPEEGMLACGVEDIGKMSKPRAIVKAAIKLLGENKETLTPDLHGQKVLITAGGTREAIDPIRFIGNRSSGKMGYALAAAARRRGADVTLVSGPTQAAAPEGVTVISVEDAKGMREAVLANRPGQNIIIMAAAVADYRPTITFWQKLKKENEVFELELSRTVDILAELGRTKNGTCLVGFAAETNDHIENARAKLSEKNLDLIVVNDASAIEQDSSEIKLIDKHGNVEEYPMQAKPQSANIILDKIISLIPRSPDPRLS